MGQPLSPRRPRSESELRGRDKSQNSFLWFRSISRSILHPHFLPYLRGRESRKKAGLASHPPGKHNHIAQRSSASASSPGTRPMPPLPGPEKPQHTDTSAVLLPREGAHPRAGQVFPPRQSPWLGSSVPQKKPFFLPLPLYEALASGSGGRLLESEAAR